MMASPGALTGASITLASPIGLDSGAGIFAGVDGVVVWNDDTGVVSNIEPSSGAVTTLGTVSSLNHAGTENWAFWGVAESFDGNDYLTYRSNGGNDIVRTRVSDSVTSTVASFPSGLSDLAAFTLSISAQRWYFHYEGSNGTFGGSQETVGFADAVIQTFAGEFTPVSPDPRTELVDSIDVTFDAPINPATFDTNDLAFTRDGSPLDLSTVTVTPVIDNTYRINNLAELTTPDGNYALTITGSGILNSGDLPLEGAATERWLTRHALPTVTSIDPLGSLIYETSETRSLPASSDLQVLQITLDAGQKFRVVVVPTGSLQTSVSVTDPSTGLLGTQTASTAGETLTFENLTAADTGTYTIAVSAAGGTTGSFQIQLLLNAVVEAENVGGPTNDTLLTAQNINSSFISLNAGTADRGAVVGAVGDVIYTTQRNDNRLRRVGADGATLSSTVITIGGQPIFSGLGLAVDPTTGVMYGNVEHEGGNGDLVTIDPATGVATVVGFLDTDGRRFAELAFDAAGVLYAITGGRNNEPSTLFQIDKTNAAVVAPIHTFSSQGAGGSAYNADNGLFYRYQRQVFESIDLSTVPATVTTIPVSGEFPDLVQALTWLGGNNFLMYSGGGSNVFNLYEIDTSGNSSVIARLDHTNVPHGMARVADDSVDVYAFSLTAGQTATLAVDLNARIDTTLLELLDSAETVLATGILDATNVSQYIANFTAPVTDTYFVRLGSALETEYRLLVTRNSTFDTESNDDLAHTQNIDATDRVLGHVGEPPALLAADDGDEHLLLVDPATGTATIVASNVGSGRGYTDLAYNSTTGVLYGSQAEGSGGLFVIDPERRTESLVGSPGSGVHALAWSPDNSTLYAVRQSAFGTINLATGSFTTIGNPGIGNIGGIAFQPGTGVLFAVLNRDPGLYTLDVTSGQATFVGNPVDRYNSLEFLPDGTLLAAVSGGDVSSTNSGNLVSLNPVTAAPTLIGQMVATGRRNPTGLELLPGDPADFYSITVGAGQLIEFSTLTPSGGPGEFVNLLDPTLELYDPIGMLVASDDNSAADGRNAELSFTTILAGLYTLRISSANNTQGEYVLDTTGLPTNIPPLMVVSSQPYDGQPVQSFDTLELSFSNALLLQTVAASDLTVDGQPATSVTVVDGDTLSFDIAALQPLNDGPVTVMIAAGALQGVQGTVNDDFTMTLVLDRVGPVVTASTVAPDGVVELGDVTVTLTFNEALNPTTLGTSDVSLVETVSGVSTLATSLVYDDANHQITMQFPNLRDGNYTLTLDSAVSGVKDVAGNLLNGSPSIPFPSGQGDPAADDFMLTFNVDTTVAAFPVPLSPIDPLGSLIYTGALESRITPTDDTDRYTILLDAGQKFSVIVDPRGGLQASVDVTGPSASSIGTGTASAAGEVLAINDLIAASAGTYTIAVSAAGGTTGDFQLQLFLNAAVETENVGGPTNDTHLTAQDVDGSFINLNVGTAERGAVVGTVGDSLYAVSRNDNLLRTVNSANGSTLTSVAISIAGGSVSSSEGIAIDPTTGILYARLQDSFASYDLVTLDPATGIATRIGNMGVSGRQFGEIVFDANGNLYGITGGGGSEGSSLFAIDKASPGNQTLLHQFNTQGSGGVALNTDDGLLYRYDNGTLKSIDVSQSPTSVVVNDLPLPGGDIGNGAGMTYAGAGEFLVSNLNTLFLLHADGSWTSLGSLSSGRTHGLALAQTGLVDVYSFSLTLGQTATLAVDFEGGLNTTLELLDSDEMVLETGATNSANLSRYIANFTVPAGGTYFVRVGSVVKTDYSVVVTRNAGFDTESNNDLAHAQNIDATEKVLGHVGEPPALLAADGTNQRLLVVDPATGAAIVVASNVGDGRGYTDLAYNSTTGVLYGSQATGGQGLFVIDLVDYSETFLGNPGSEVHALAWSPDNSTLYAVRSGRFGTIDPVTGGFTEIGNPGIGKIGGIAFQPGTGTLFAVLNQSSGLYTLDPATGQATFVGIPGERFNALEFLPNGMLLAGAGQRSSDSTEGDLVRLDPATGAATAIGDSITSGSRNLTGLELLPGDVADFYSITADVGDFIEYLTLTPSGGPGEFVNLLDPMLELYDPNGDLVASDDNSSFDDRNAQLSFEAVLSGTYTLRVSAIGDTRGEYVLSSVVLDLGDAPTAEQSDFAASYPTLLIDDGARHLLVDDAPRLGARLDGDLDGAPTAAADGDDTLDGNDDEDGVTFASSLRVSLAEDRTGEVTVNASANALLDAWIDFNQDGDWNDDGEQILTNQVVTTGDNLLTFTIPTAATLGTTFSRFRLSTAGNLAPTGFALDGEVEDYAVTLTPALVEIEVTLGTLRITDFGGETNNLTVILDSRTNQFVVTSTANDLKGADNLPTNVIRVSASGVSGLLADLSFGNDRLDLHRLSLPTTVHGGEGNDELLGGFGQDMLFGEAGNDLVRGGAHHDTVSGGTGTDIVYGDSGTDVQREETDAAVVIVNRTSIIGVGSTPDEAEVFPLGTEKVQLIGGGSANRFDASASIRVVTLEGGGGNDTLIGSSLHDQLLGGAGEDSLNGGSGNDLLNGGTENDQLTGGLGNDAITGGDGTDSLNETRNTSFSLSNTSLTGLGTDTLAGLEHANLTGGASSNVFTVTDWTGTGTFVGGGATDTIAVTKDGNFTLTDTSLVTSDGMNLTLTGFLRANLTGGAGNNVFLVSAWHGTGTLKGLGGTDRIEATRDTDLTLTNTALASAAGSGFGTLSLSSVETANLSGGASANKLIARLFTLGSVTLQGNAGNDVLIGGSKNDSLTGGPGRDLLIGGAGVDTLNGDADDDILIGGTSTHSSNLTALNAIMAEWGSLVKNYATRVGNLRDTGVGVGNSIKLKNTTVQNDANAADSLTGSTGGVENTDWFFQSTNDVLDAILGETVTTAP